ncbi:hypothetical protein BDV30DRAFT_202601 [Aspergillus minisclerotigenes]|uniref:Uncharacterized protein n=1 Tax=Aspergillus minisclerotigenes TaxID=656917 RepID=A0A5N6JLU9_9EURO|nr:hypothetical protein BDV30DRAFT_202601 [Aspergillus minisclerotigenes]
MSGGKGSAQCQMSIYHFVLSTLSDYLYFPVMAVTQAAEALRKRSFSKCVIGSLAAVICTWSLLHRASNQLSRSSCNDCPDIRLVSASFPRASASNDGSRFSGPSDGVDPPSFLMEIPNIVRMMLKPYPK